MDGNREMDSAHQVPKDVDEETVNALGALSKALETTERARGHLYGFHQLTGTADFELGDHFRVTRVGGRPAVQDVRALLGELRQPLFHRLRMFLDLPPLLQREVQTVYLGLELGKAELDVGGLWLH